MEREEVLRLYEAYADDVFRLALSYLHNRQEAEDVCHSVFLKLLDSKKQPATGKEKPWLLTCTANACKDALRSVWRKRRVELDENTIFATEEDRALWEAVHVLSPKYRAVVHLYYYEGYAQDEIAEILQISRTAVQTRMSRAREKLKEVLKEHE